LSARDWSRVQRAYDAKGVATGNRRVGSWSCRLRRWHECPDTLRVVEPDVRRASEPTLEKRAKQ